MTLMWQAILTTGVLAGITFIAIYSYTAKGLWHRYSLGWHLMGMAGSLTAALSLLLYSSFAGPVSPHVWLVVMTAISTLMVQRVWILLFITRNKEERDEDDNIHT